MENIKARAERNINNLKVGELFFLESWCELTNDETHSSYRPKVMNLKLILDELITYLEETIQGQTNFKFYVEEIAAETKGFLKKEKNIFDENSLLYFQFETSLEDMQGFSGRKDKDIENSYSNLVILKKVQLFLKNNYKNLIIEHLKLNIKNNEQKNILIFTSAIISHYISEGLTLKKLYFCRNQLFYWKIEGLIFEERLEKAFESLECEKKYTVFLKMTSPNAFLNEYPKINNVDFYNSIREEVFSDVPEKFKETSEFIRYAKVKIESSDPHRATLAARATVEKALDYIMFTSTPQNVEFAYKSYIVGASEDSTLNHSYKHDYESSFSAETLLQLLSNNTLEKRSKKRLESSLKFFRMGLSTSTEHIAFTNTWTAIEYILTGNKANVDIKKKMNDEAIKILSIDYISSLINDMRKNLDILNIECEIADSWSNVTNKEFLSLIQRSEKIQVVIDSITQSLLLKYRLIEISNLFKNNEDIIKYLEEHNERVKWQLSRIYRIRNIIAHEAHKSDVTLLLPHLKMYCFNILETIFRLIELNKNEIKNIDDLIIRIKDWYEYLKDHTKENGTIPLYDDYLNQI